MKSDEAFLARLETIVSTVGSAASLARALGCSGATVSEWRSGKTRPRPEFMTKLALVGGVRVEWLQFGSGPREPTRPFGTYMPIGIIAVAADAVSAAQGASSAQERERQVYRFLGQLEVSLRTLYSRHGSVPSEAYMTELLDALAAIIAMPKGDNEMGPLLAHPETWPYAAALVVTAQQFLLEHGLGSRSKDAETGQGRKGKRSS